MKYLTSFIRNVHEITAEVLRSDLCQVEMFRLTKTAGEPSVLRIFFEGEIFQDGVKVRCKTPQLFCACF